MKGLKRFLWCCGCVLFAVSSIAAETRPLIWEKDGSLNATGKIEGQVLKLHHSSKQAFPIWKMVKSPDGPFALEFTTKIPENSGSSHAFFAVDFSGNKGKLGIYFHGKIVHYNLSVDGKRVRQSFCKIDDWNDQVENRFRFQVGRKLIEVFLQGKKLFEMPCELFPVEELRLWARELSAEVSEGQLTVETESQSAVIPGVALNGNFDGRAEIITYTGEAILPQGNYTLEEGLSGKALLPGAGGVLYSIPDLFRNQAGALMFWMKPEKDQFRGALLRGLNGQNQDRLGLDVHRMFTVSLFPTEQTPLKQFLLGPQTCWQNNGNWTHLAVAWDKEEIKLFINGLPYVPRSRPKPFLTGTKDLESIRQIRFHGGVKYDDFQLLSHPVDDAEVYAAYRKRMPVDLVMEKQMFDASEIVRPEIWVVPGGYAMRPAPVDQPSPAVDIVLKTSLFERNENREVIWEKEWKLHVDGPQLVKLPEVMLKSGNYLLQTEIDFADTRNLFAFEVDTHVPVVRKAAVSEDIVKGKLLVEYKFDNPDALELHKKGAAIAVGILGKKPYLEVGSHRLDRLAREITFPADVLGKPVLIEIEWPDDKPRMAGHYLYQAGKGYNHRDRLQQGTVSGLDIPLTGKNIVTSYFFWPGLEEYLIEFRTMADGMPAAVSAVRIYAIDSPLAPPVIREPSGMPGRKFGNIDEDQTFDTNLGKDWYDKNKHKYINRDAFVFDELVKYMGYTGQNTFHYALLRYWYSYYPYVGNQDAHSLIPHKTGGVNYMVDVLGKHDIGFTAILNMSRIPELFFSTESTLWMTDAMGNTAQGFTGPFPNFPTHPKVLSLYLRHVRDIAGLLKDAKNVDGFELWLNPWGNSIENGYDDYTIGEFTKETGVSCPVLAPERYAFLNGEKQAQWLDWRAKKATGFYHAVRKVLNEFNPDWKLYCVVKDYGLRYLPGNRTILPETTADFADRSALHYSDSGIDRKAIESLPNTFVVPMRRGGEQYWQLSNKGKTSAIGEYLYNYKDFAAAFRSPGKSAPLISCFMAYFEDLQKTLIPEKYTSMFQDADIKPHGRYWLRELAFNLAATDAQVLTIGGQPLGTIGREAQAREFAKAYRALPQISFTDVPGADDPVTVRYAKTKNGTYLYLVNLAPFPCTVQLPMKEKLIDLSDDKVIADGKIALDIYQLRSFLIQGKQLEVPAPKVTLSEAGRNLYDAKTKEILEAESRIPSEIRNKAPSFGERLKYLHRNGKFAELHRLIFSPDAAEVLKKAKSVKLILQQERMINEGHIAVNCGSPEFYLAPGGKLFFPDQRFGKSIRYGYSGTYAESINRNNFGLKNTAFSELFQTELYNIDRYSFRLEKGDYIVRLYLRFGFQPGFVADSLLFSLWSNGQPLFENIDLYRLSNGDFSQVVVLETKPLKVENQLLELEFRPEKNSKGKILATARLLNGIEVIRCKQ